MKKYFAVLGVIVLFLAIAGQSQTNNPPQTATGTASITGGTIDGTVIGGTTPAAGSFTTINVSNPATGIMMGQYFCFISGVFQFSSNNSGCNGNGAITAGFITLGGTATATSFNPTSAKTTVSCSTSGNAVFSQPMQGTSDKKVLIHLAACVGTASYTYPAAFTNAPSCYASSLVACSIAGTPSTTAVTVTGATTTGSLVLEDY